jgi:hypothetical protein
MNKWKGTTLVVSAISRKWPALTVYLEAVSTVKALLRKNLMTRNMQNITTSITRKKLVGAHKGTQETAGDIQMVIPLIGAFHVAAKTKRIETSTDET